MKRVIPKLLLFFCLIPWGAAMIFTVAECIFHILFLDLGDITDWGIAVSNLLSIYMLELLVFALLGICSSYIFFGKAYKAALLTVLTMAGTIFFPFTRYFVGHMLLTDIMYDTAMLNFFNENWLFAENLLMNAILFLIAILLTRLFSGMLFKDFRAVPQKMLSLRNPINFATLIFCAAAVIMASILFVSMGDFSFDSILSLLIEYLINAIRFFVIVYVAFFVRKGMSTSELVTKK